MARIIHIDVDLLREILTEELGPLANEDIGIKDAVHNIINEIYRIEREEDNRPGSFYN